MGKFITRRFAHAILVIVVATFVLFVGLFVFTDPFASSGEKAVPPDVQAALRVKFGMDQPFFQQYLTYMGNMFTGDLGIDLKQRREVSEMLLEKLPNTARLALVAIVIEFVIGVAAGILAAVSQYTFRDALVTVLTTIGIGVPVFVIGIFMRANLSGVWIFPQLPRSAFAEPVPWWQEIILPAVALAILDAAFIARLMRGSMLEVLRADYIRTARAKGLSESRVIGKHALRNSIIPVVTYTGVTLGALLGGAIITETIFQYDGIGYLLFKGISEHNSPIVLAIVAFSVLAYVVLSTLVDILYAYLDPRIRLH